MRAVAQELKRFFGKPYGLIDAAAQIDERFHDADAIHQEPGEEEREDCGARRKREVEDVARVFVHMGNNKLIINITSILALAPTSQVADGTIYRFIISWENEARSLEINPHLL